MFFRLIFRAPASLALPLALAACSAAERTAETSAPRAVPTEVTTDADRRAIYNANAPRGTAARQPVPDATPNTLRLGEQASDINRLKRPESLNTNDPNITTNETRLQRLDQGIPDTLRRP
jgi:nitrous oxide reductase accessory protein NosL